MASEIPTLAKTVTVRNANGRAMTYKAGTRPPKWAAAAIRNPKAWDGGRAPDVRPKKKAAR